MNTELTNQGASANGANPITVTFTKSKRQYTIYSSGTIEYAGIKSKNNYLASEIFEANGTTQDKMHIGDYINFDVDYDNVFADQYGATGAPVLDKYAGKWRILNVNENTVKIISAGIPVKYLFQSNARISESVSALRYVLYEIYLNRNGYTLRGQYTCHGFKDTNGVKINMGNNNSELIRLFSSANGIDNPRSVRALTKEDIDEVTG